MFKHDWEPATGRVLDTRFGSSSAGDHGSTEHFLIEVTTQTGAVFKVELGYPGFAANFRAPHVGQVVRMRCNPAHTKAAFDTTDPALSWKPDAKRKKEQWAQQLRGERR